MAGFFHSSKSPSAPVAATADGHSTKASTFAYPADVQAFQRCKATGKSDEECFAVGDNGVGCWGDDCTSPTVAMCALPPEDMVERWGSVEAAKHKYVIVAVHGILARCRLSDRMPHRANITNDCGIDLNPGACRALGITPPDIVIASWRWEEAA